MRHVVILPPRSAERKVELPQHGNNITALGENPVSFLWLIQLTRCLASTLAPAVRVNSVSPGGIERGQAKEFVRRYLQKTPLARMATENDVVASTVFLLSDASRQITGQNIVVDGGLSVQ